MMNYQVQHGDTIAEVTRRMKTDWQTLRAQNPEAIGRSSKNGNWFLKEGATVKLESENSFQALLQNAVDTKEPVREKQDLPVEPGRFIEHTLQPGETLWELGVKKYHVHVDDIMRDNNITNPQALQIGQKIRIRVLENPGPQNVVASWYGEQHHGRPMANGEIYNMHADTIAHKEIPLGTRVELENPQTGQIIQATVTDRGPYVEGRDVDLSYGLAQKLSLVDQGVGELIMRIL